jgi:hypothetical protein
MAEKFGSPAAALTRDVTCLSLTVLRYVPCLTISLCITDKAAIQAVVDRMTRAVEKTPKAEGTINVTQPVRGVLRCVLCCSECVLCAGCAVLRLVCVLSSIHRLYLG